MSRSPGGGCSQPPPPRPLRGCAQLGGGGSAGRSADGPGWARTWPRAPAGLLRPPLRRCGGRSAQAPRCLADAGAHLLRHGYLKARQPVRFARFRACMFDRAAAAGVPATPTPPLAAEAARQCTHQELWKIGMAQQTTKRAEITERRVVRGVTAARMRRSCRCSSRPGSAGRFDSCPSLRERRRGGQPRRAAAAPPLRPHNAPPSTLGGNARSQAVLKATWHASRQAKRLSATALTHLVWQSCCPANSAHTSTHVRPSASPAAPSRKTRLESGPGRPCFWDSPCARQGGTGPGQPGHARTAGICRAHLRVVCTRRHAEHSALAQPLLVLPAGQRRLRGRVEESGRLVLAQVPLRCQVLLQAVHVAAVRASRKVAGERAAVAPCDGQLVRGHAVPRRAAAALF